MRLSQNIFSYIHNDDIWHIQTVNYAYGRLGLRIEADAVSYVQDMIYACPAHGYMLTLLRDLSEILKQSNRSTI